MSNQEEYTAFLQYSESHALIADIINETLARIDENIKEIHLESQLLPQLVTFARDVIDQCLEVWIKHLGIHKNNVDDFLDGIFWAWRSGGGPTNLAGWQRLFQIKFLH